MAFTPSTQYNLHPEDYHNCDSCDLINGRGIPLISSVALQREGRTQVGLGRNADESVHGHFTLDVCDLRDDAG
jgi:hypothetical protein